MPPGQSDAEGEVGNGPQIEGLEGVLCVVDEPPAKKLKYVNKSLEHIQHARDARGMKVLVRKNEKLHIAGARADEALKSICALLPGAAAVGGQPKMPSISRKKRVEEKDCLIIVRALHIHPKRCKMRLGVKHAKLQAVGAQIIERRQIGGLERLLGNAKVATTAARRNGVHVSFLHMWDEVN